MPHHMIDVAEPEEPFDAARYARMARAILDKLNAAGTLPVIAGGTGLYIKALLHGLTPEAINARPVRERLKKEAATHGGQVLYERLALCDPQAAQQIHPNDTFRIVRALEVYQLTGHPISALHAVHRFDDHPFDALKIGLDMDRKALYERIDQRVEAMIAAGLIDEVNRLMARGCETVKGGGDPNNEAGHPPLCQAADDLV